MKGTSRVLALGVVVAWSALGSGCSISSLKDSNRRLKESNDRLISENNRLEEEIAALQKRLGGQDTLASIEPVTAKVMDPAPLDKTDLADELLIDPDVEVTRTAQGVRFRVPDKVFFSPGQATLSTRGRGILDKVARIVARDYPGKTVRVDGHTDDTPTRKVRAVYPTNWELSVSRAVTVVRYLVEHCNLNAHKIYPAGFSYYRPVANGRSTSSRSQNRRVEILVLDEQT